MTWQPRWYDVMLARWVRLYAASSHTDESAFELTYSLIVRADSPRNYRNQTALIGRQVRFVLARGLMLIFTCHFWDQFEKEPAPAFILRYM